MFYSIYCDGELIYNPRVLSDSLVLRDVKLKMEVNSAGSLAFKIDKFHPMASYIFPFRSVIDVYRDDVCIWRGRVLEDKIDFNGASNKKCEGALAFLNDIMYPAADGAYGHVDDWIHSILTRYNTYAATPRKIYEGVINVSPNVEENRISIKGHDYTSCWDIMKEVLDESGGYGRIRIAQDGKAYFDFDYQLPELETKDVRFGVNLLDLKKELHIEEFANAIVPLGTLKQNAANDYDRVDISNFSDGQIGNSGYVKDGVYVVDQDSVNIFGRFETSVIFDKFTETDIETLVYAGCNYLALTAEQTMQIDASFIDMNYIDPTYNPVNIFDAVRIFSIPHDYTSGDTIPLLGFEIDLNKPTNNKYTISKTRSMTMIDYILKR